MQIPPKSSSNALLTRAEMAKMLVVLLSPFRKGNSDTVAEKSTTIQCSHFSDLHQAHEKFQSSIIKVCQWGLMGYYSDGVTIKPAFNPNAFVTLAEIATTFSRLFRGNMYQGSEQWRYHNHLLALQKIGIIPQNIDPMKTEQRKNILKMLSPIPSLL
ncbi:MAG: hypothetical protein LBG59_00710 [Candidatus Peribacteria bacterium]|jgi:hypothetical protein|nr:hypothetical protein [Candidatus Peribacteria bacterium]